MKDITLCLLLRKLHVYSVTHHRLVLIYIVTFADLIRVSACIWANNILGKILVLTCLRMA